jgi:hypothetical protein
MKHILLLLLLTSPLHAQDFAVAKLEASPRHHEWVDIQQADRSVKAFVAYPEISEKALTLIVIHENRGLTDWVRGFADDLAAAGYIAIAPDFLSGFSAEFTRTSDFPNQDASRDALYEVPQDRITAGLEAVQAYVSTIEAANGNVAVIGFCWGGSQTFRYATHGERTHRIVRLLWRRTKRYDELCGHLRTRLRVLCTERPAHQRRYSDREFCDAVVWKTIRVQHFSGFGSCLHAQWRGSERQ